MVLDAVLAWLHFACIFALVAVLTVEMTSLRYCDRPQTIMRLVKVDLVYLIIAILVLVSGLARAVFGIKGWAFYTGSWLFHLKIGIFILVGLISIIPTLNFMRWNKALKTDAGFMPPARETARTRLLIHVELTLILLLPLIAALMARGFGQIVH